MCRITVNLISKLLLLHLEISSPQSSNIIQSSNAAQQHVSPTNKESAQNQHNIMYRYTLYVLHECRHGSPRLGRALALSPPRFQCRVTLTNMSFMNERSLIAPHSADCTGQFFCSLSSLSSSPSPIYVFSLLIFLSCVNSVSESSACSVSV